MAKTHPEEWKFRRAYANVPLPLRDEICCVIDDEPLTFRTARLEIDNKTEAGYKAIQQLLKMEII